MEDHYCEDCRFWRLFNREDNTGECFCKAPLPYIHKFEEKTLNKVTRWPLTKGKQHCGEFQNKE